MAFPMKNTPNGFNPYDLMSGMQKFIRRGMEEEALYCFYELEAGGHYSMAVNRLKVTVHEDVGVANLQLLMGINGLIETMTDWYKAKNGAWRLALGNIILTACRGKRTRISDHFVCAMAFKRVNGYVLDLDKYEHFVHDKHTMKGKKKGRGIEHFFTEGIKLEVPESFKTEKEYMEEELEHIGPAKAKGDAWELYRMDNRTGDYTGGQGKLDLNDGITDD